MSADNGIYILMTPDDNGGMEYRVRHLQAVENVDAKRCSVHGQYFKWDGSCQECANTRGYSEDPDIHIQNAREMWAGTEVFSSEEAALALAADQLRKLAVCEYGISLISIDRRF